ncbi:unnamed protein product [Bursaphelenchus xylophilus]|uniref:(pine wood nematode) hypothetical protein n=1 Tax=Bursaphelenchus xylophilus TaxID=6326 RepID=A0A1I7RR25_BURXY|nr:unnamed protein product [Bursaphelenchus xylophilus]CAG9130816.1 unnamed protein product [Bursaphelenchus xylophilus]
MAGITAQNVPLLNESDSDSDVETGRLPTYAQAETGAGLKFLMGNNSQPRDGKEAVALTDVNIRMGFLRKVLGILSFQFVVTVVLCGAVYLTPTVRGFVQHQ